MTMTFELQLVDRTAPFRANTNTVGGQRSPDVLGLSNGGFVVAYVNDIASSSDFTQLDFYDAANNHVSTAIPNTGTQSQTSFDPPTLTQLSNGNVLVVWADFVTGDGGLRGRLFTETGAAIGDELDLGFATAGPREPSVTALPGGGFAISSSTHDGENSEVYVDVYGAAGNVLFGRHASNNPDDNEDDYNSSITVLADGGFVVAWTNEFFNAITLIRDYEVRAAFYNADGSVRKSDFLVESTANNTTFRDPAVVGLPNGNFALAYIDDNRAGEGGSSGITLRIYTSTGVVVNTQHVNIADPNGNELEPELTVLDNGFIVVTWTRESTNADIFARIFDQAGNPLALNGGSSNQFTIRDSGQIWFDTLSAVSVIESGRFVTAWQENTFEGNGGDGDRSQITARVQELRRQGLGDDTADTAQGDALGDTFFGFGGNDELFGFGGDDVLLGHDGNDNLNGGDGVDELWGGNNNDRLFGGSEGDSLYGDDGADELNGDAGDDMLVGGAGFDTLNGGADNDTLNGNEGFDTLVGGTGNDSYTLDSGTTTDVGEGLFLFTFDAVTEGADAGVDTVYVRRVGSGVNGLSSYTLTANVEYGMIEGTAAFNLTGNALANILVGNGAANTLEGGQDDDTLDGGAGADTLNGGEGDDTLQGSSGQDASYGFAGNDFLRDGGSDALGVRDFLYGGVGHDIYEVWNTLASAQDIVFENNVDDGAQGGSPSDVDSISSTGEFFRDFYSTGEVLRISEAANAQFATTYLVGGASSNAQIFGNSGSNIISTYGGSKTVDAGGGTDAISFSRYDLDAGFEGVNTLVSRAGTGLDYLYDFQSGVDKVDLRSFAFGISGQQVLAQGVNVFGSDPNSFSDDYCYFYLTNAGGVDNYVAFVGLTTAQLQANDFITA